MSDKVTIFDIAEKAGVSIATVNRAFKENAKINPEKKQLILSIAKECGYKVSKVAVGLSRKNIKIGVVMIGLISEFYNELIRGIKAAHSELIDYKVECNIKVIEPYKPYPELENNYLSSLNYFLENKFHGVIVCISDFSEAVIRRVNQLADSGIPVATLIVDAPQSKRLFVSSANAVVMAKMAAELLNGLMHGKKVALFTGNRKASIHDTIVKSFIDEAQRYSLDITDIYDNKDNQTTASENINKMLHERPDINGIYVTSANSIPICRVIVENNLAGKIKLITSDIYPELAGYIRQGVVDATLYQNPFEQAKSAFMNLYYHIAENKSVAAEIMTIPQIIIKSNLELYI